MVTVKLDHIPSNINCEVKKKKEYRLAQNNTL
jgi:hypothetical protein